MEQGFCNINLQGLGICINNCVLTCEKIELFIRVSLASKPSDQSRHEGGPCSCKREHARGCTGWDEPVQIKGGLAIYCVDTLCNELFSSDLRDLGGWNSEQSL